MTVVKRPLFRLEDYRPTPYTIPQIALDFDLHPQKTKVRTKLTIEARAGTKPGTPVVLDGDELNLTSIAINGIALAADDYRASAEKLEILNPPTIPFILEIVTEINPQANRQLMGLYRSSGVFCTQCEAEGFRRITYFYDRPDVLSVYTVRIEADVEICPILLSNGNPQESGKLTNGRHFALWHDPFPKPSYLFALVGGDLEAVHDSHKTMSGRQVALTIYVEKGKTGRALYAMDALKRSFAWDEQVFGREYDLDVFNVVAVSDFNMGAMENKGLNIFNDKCVLAAPETETDSDYGNVERVIAHEYFHNWTGDRITCRDWFQLCLKEGLTVYRDQEFSSDQRSRSVHRIGDVRLLKAAQFPEDAGPLAHPVRPRQYSEINNFYTTTIYEKGAEIVRMIHTLLGAKQFRAGMDIYFERHDGEACTIEDFITCFSDVSGHDFSQFMLWYEQAGTPHVTANFAYNESEGSLTITLEQSLKATPGQEQKEPMVIPICFGLVGADGLDMAYQAGNHIEGDVIMLTEQKQSFHFTGLKSRPVPSLLRGFSAPITLDSPLSDDELAFLAGHDSDQVNRWQSLNRLLTQELVISAKHPEKDRQKEREALITLIGTTTEDEKLEPAFRAMALALPSEMEIARAIDHDVDPDAIFKARENILAEIAQAHSALFSKLIDTMKPEKPFSPDAQNAGKRAFANILFDYLSIAEKSDKRAANLYFNADNMTDRMAALRILVHRFGSGENAQNALADFEKRFSFDPLVMDKWFSVQATTAGSQTLETVKELTKHPLFSFDNPNRVRALVASFAAGNQTGFNRIDGAAYDYLCEMILTIDKNNPQLASRLLTIMRSWRALEENRRNKLENSLKRIASNEGLSTDVADIIQRMLAP